jgi:hypothetical protein
LEAIHTVVKLTWKWFEQGLLPDLHFGSRWSAASTISGPELTVGEIARRFGATYLKQHGHHLRGEEIRILHSLAACRTGLCGWHRYRCDECGHEVTAYNSCGDGHCPGCQHAKRGQWLEKRRCQLLPAPYFHTIVPLPSELSRLALYNRRLIYNLLFSKAAETLREVAASHGLARIGFFAVLHTWGQKLQHHVHLHIVMVGGGLSADGTQWTTARDNYFLPIPILRLVFRAKMLEALMDAYEEGQLHFGGELKHLAKPSNFLQWWGQLLQKDWVVHVKPPFGAKPDRVLKYLARYVYRVGISNGRLLELKGDQVTFSYRDYTEENQPEKQTTLPAEQFLGRFLQHVLPPGFMRIRHYGFLGGPYAAKRIKAIRELIASTQGETQTPTASLAEEHQPPDSGDPSSLSSRVCPKCGVGLMQEILCKPRFSCRPLWKVLWYLFPSWPLEPDDSS